MLSDPYMADSCGKSETPWFTMIHQGFTPHVDHFWVYTVLFNYGMYIIYSYGNNYGIPFG